MLFIYLYHGDLYSDLWKSDLYFRPAALICYLVYLNILFTNLNTLHS